LIIHTERREVEEDGDGNGATSAAAAQLISQTSTNAVLLLYPPCYRLFDYLFILVQ
jgi:hypothetical protein